MAIKINASITSLLFFLVSSSWAIMIKSNLLSENYSDAIIALYLYIYIFIVFQTLLIYFILRSFKISNQKKIILIGLFFLFNFYTLILSVTSEFVMQQKMGKIKYFFIALVISFFFTYFLITKEKVLKILCIFYLGSNLFYFFDLQETFFSFKNRNVYEKDSLLDKNFKIKKNIYIYSFESLMPASLIEKHLNIKNAEFFEVMKKEKLIIPKNNFADNVPTGPSISSSFYIDPVMWRNLEDHKKFKFFAGRAISPLYKLLKNNGYLINTGYSSPNFGAPGKFVDQHITMRSMNNSDQKFLDLYPNFCQNKMPWYHLQMFSYCEAVAFIFGIKSENRGLSLIDFNNYVIGFIKSSNKPKFSWYHIYSQTHPGSNRSDFVNEYKNQLPGTAEYIRNIINNIKEKDPNSILIIFGDHSPMIETFSLEEDLKESIKIKYDDLDQYKILDTYPTQSAVLDHSNLCPNAISNISKSKYSTNTKIINEFLMCFMGTNKVLDYKIRYSLPEGKNFENYLYE